MKLRIVVLGAGFGGLELSTILSERIGDRIDLTLIDKNDSFYFGFSKLDLMFGRKPAEALKISYSNIVKTGVKFRQETITAIDPHTRRVTTQNEIYDADILVVALGAEYNIDATPGLAEGGYEFYSFSGAERIGEILPFFKKGHAIIGVTATPFKCPPAPSEAALLLHEYLTRRGVRSHCKISLILPFTLPIPPSLGTSKALLKAFAERDINYIPENMVASIDPDHKVAILDDGTELPFDVFLGIPEHCVPKVVSESGMTVNDWIPVDKNSLKTRYSNVYAIGDVTSVGVPKAGMFAEGAARVAAETIIAELDESEYSLPYDGKGTCYVEFGQDKVGRADVDFFSGPYATGVFFEASEAISAEKEHFESFRRKRWF
jgi:sulfide:quinone oxidoreductase